MARYWKGLEILEGDIFIMQVYSKGYQHLPPNAVLITKYYEELSRIRKEALANDQISETTRGE